MALLYSAGELSNLLARGTLTCNPAALAAYPVAKTCDGTPWPFTFGSVVADSYVQLRNNLLVDPGFESGVETYWPFTAGTTSVQGVTKHSGAWALKLEGAGGTVAYQGQAALTVRAGCRMKVGGWLNRVAGRGLVFVYNHTTGKYLTNAGAWVSGVWNAGAAITDTASVGWTDKSLTFQVEALSVVRQPTCTLQVVFYAWDPGVAYEVYWDDCYLIPAVNGAALFGHNIQPRNTLKVRYSSDAFAVDDHVAVDLAAEQPTFYGYLAAPVYSEYWRLHVAGTPLVAPSFDEAWLGYLESLTVGQQDGWSVTHTPAAYAPGSLHLPYRVGTGDYAARVLRMEFERWTETEWRELIDEIDVRTRRGRHSMVIVPSTLSSEARIIMGRPDPGELALTREGPVTWKLPLTVYEMAPSLRLS